MSCKKLDDGGYEITYIHTGASFKNNQNYSSVGTMVVYPDDNVTYVNVSKYLK